MRHSTYTATTCATIPRWALAARCCFSSSRARSPRRAHPIRSPLARRLYNEGQLDQALDRRATGGGESRRRPRRRGSSWAASTSSATARTRRASELDDARDGPARASIRARSIARERIELQVGLAALLYLRGALRPRRRAARADRRVVGDARARRARRARSTGGRPRSIARRRRSRRPSAVSSIPGSPSGWSGAAPRLGVRAGELLARGGGPRRRRSRSRVVGRVAPAGSAPRSRRDRGVALRADLDKLVTQAHHSGPRRRLPARERKQAADRP